MTTLYKASVQINDMDGGDYHTHRLVLARHPSETEERMMMRLLAFILYASNDLTFGPGLCVADEPDLYRRNGSGGIGLWLEVGQPSPRAVRKACRRADQVVTLAYGRGANPWWQHNRRALERQPNLTVLRVPPAQSLALSCLAKPSMELTAKVRDGVISLMRGAEVVRVEPLPLLVPS